MKLLTKRKILLCYFIAIWIAGVLMSYLFMGGSYNIDDDISEVLKAQEYVLRGSKEINLSDPRLEQTLFYCNPLSTEVTGDEGIVESGYTLEFAAFLIRHGDRGPTIDVPSMSTVNCGVPASHARMYNDYYNSISRVKLSIDLQLQRAPRSSTCVSKQLTQIGIVQHIKLGSFLNERYRDLHDLLGDSWSTNQFQLYTTPTSRTYQSALAFMHGFAPDIYTSGKEIQLSIVNSNFCFEKTYCGCSIVHKLNKRIEKAKRKLIDEHPAIINLLDKFKSNLEGINEPLTPAVSFDSLNLLSCHQHYYPCRASGSCVMPEHIQRLYSYMEWSESTLGDNVDYEKVSRLIMHGFFIHLLQNMLASVVPEEHNSGIHPKVILYSGHEVTLRPVLMAVGYRSEWLIPYASRIVFELYSHKFNEYKTNFYVRILFNGKDITRYTTFCKRYWTSLAAKSTLKVRCPLDSFINFVNHSHLKLMNASSFVQACKLRNFVRGL